LCYGRRFSRGGRTILKQAVILCGGQGTRLGELTEDVPKPLLEVGDRPFLDHLIQEITRWGFERILLLGGYQGEMLKAMYDGVTFNHTSCQVVLESQPLGTGGALVNAEEHLDDHFMLFNGDSWIDYDLTELMSKKPLGIHMIGRYSSNAQRHETLDINKDRIKDILERGKQSKGFINSGVYVINKDIIPVNPLHPVESFSFEHDLIPIIVRRGMVTASIANSSTFFIDIGIPEDYERAQIEVMKHRTRPALFIDRDNTLTYDREGYTHHPDDMEFKPGAIEMIKHANHMGYYVFVVTNQGGVTKGQYEEHYILEFHRKMQYTLAEHGAHIDALEYEIELDSRRRKPRPGMLEDLIEAWPVDLGRSIMIGDKEADAEAGFRAGIVGLQWVGGDLFEMFEEYIR